MRREILERPRVVRHREERGIRVAEGEVGGGVKNNPPNIRMALFGKRDRNHRITC